MVLAAAALATRLLATGVDVGPGGIADLADSSLIQTPAQRPKVYGFGADFTLGYLATHSAETTTSLNTELKLGYNSPKWRHRVDLQAIEATTNGTTTAEQYYGAAQSDRLLGTRSYVFGFLGYLHNRFNGYHYQTSEAIGYGNSLVDTNTQVLKLEIGIGATQAEEITGSSKRSALLRGVENYGWQFNSNGSISQSLTLEKSSFNLYSQFQTKLTAQLVGNFALVVAYTIQHNSTVPTGSPQTTTATSVSVQYSFGRIFGGS